MSLSRFYFNRNTPKKFNGYKFQTLRLADQVWTLTRRFVIDGLDDHGVEPVEADEDEDVEDEEADLDDDDYKEVGNVLSDQMISKQNTSAHLEHKHNNFSPMHILS